MSSLWHFGDSWGLSGEEKNFSHHLSDKLNLKNINLCSGGHSNEMILSDIIKFQNDFKPGDFLLINWSYFSRPTLIWKDKITSHIVSASDDISAQEDEFISYRDYILKKYIDESYYEFFIFSQLFINPILNNLLKNHIKIFHIFIANFNSLTINGKERECDFKTFNIPGKLLDFGKFGYSGFLFENDFVANPDESMHYKRGKQIDISDILFEKIKNVYQ